MESPTNFGCKYCGRADFLTAKALRSHHDRSFCGQARERDLAGLTPVQGVLFGANDNCVDAQHSHEDDYDMAHMPPPSPPRKPTMPVVEIRGIEGHDVDAVTRQMEAIFDDNEGSDEESESSNASDDDYDPTLTEASSTEADDGPEPDEFMPESPENTEPDTWIRDQFRTYCSHAKQRRRTFRIAMTKIWLVMKKNSPKGHVKR